MADFVVDDDLLSTQNTTSAATTTTTETSTCELCGWIAAIISMIAFGSFGVPVKSDVAQRLDIDPLVMQSYKTAVCFITSWFVLLTPPSSSSSSSSASSSQNFTFTPWGIVSGLFWVPGGVATIYAIKNAGLTVTLGVSSSCIVLVSFSWGILIFGEHVHSQLEAILAVICMICGIVGMTYYSSPSSSASASPVSSPTTPSNQSNSKLSSSQTYQQIPHPLDTETSSKLQSSRQTVNDVDSHSENHTPQSTYQDEPERGNNILKRESNGINHADNDDDDDDNDGIVRDDKYAVSSFDVELPTIGGENDHDHHHHHHRSGNRVLGIAAAIFNGVYGGSIMVPMKFAPPEASGKLYVISFAIGASIVTIGLWIIRLLYNWYRLDNCENKSWNHAFRDLPSFHLQQMWLYGGLCGLLWSIGNFCSILSVEFLGEGIGYSVIQCAMLVSGLWGIFYFHEIQGYRTIFMWFGSAIFAVTGILVLSYEHHAQ